MNALRTSSLGITAHLLAVGSGVLLALAFAPYAIAGAAFVAPGTILLAAMLHRKASFRLGYVAALTANLIELRWLLNIPVPYAPILGWLALSAFLALYTGAWTWLCVRVAPGFGIESREGARTPSVRSFLFPIFCAAAWTACELASGKILSGFPWNHLGNTQHAQIPLIQIAAFTGVPGISFLIVWFSVALMTLVHDLQRHGPRSHAWKLRLVPPLVVLSVVMAYGLRTSLQGKPLMRPLSVAMVQPSIPQTMIWDASSNTNRLHDLLAWSETAMTNRPDLLLWPEAGLPGLLNHEEWVFKPVSEFARRHQIWFICGGDDAAPRDNGSGLEADYFNSAFLMNRAGRLVAKYDKQQLVMFGEYVPLTRWLPFLKWLTPITGGFTRGTKPVTFELGDLDVRASVIICFEDVFAPVARRAAVAETDLLINLTNDGWFGTGAAQRQQAACGVFRAVENGLPLVRCTNNGLTCWIDAHGRVREIFHDAAGGIFGPGVLNCTVELPDSGTRIQTFYNRHGDWFAWLCASLTALGGAPPIWQRISDWRSRNSRA